MHRNLDRDKLLAALSELSEDRDEALATLPDVLAVQGEGHVTVSIVDPDGILRITGSNDAALAPGTVVPGDGIVAATREMGLTMPLVVRLEGTNVDKGKEILRKSGLNIITADNLADAAQKVVHAVREDAA